MKIRTHKDSRLIVHLVNERKRRSDAFVSRKYFTLTIKIKKK